MRPIEIYGWVRRENRAWSAEVVAVRENSSDRQRRIIATAPTYESALSELARLTAMLANDCARAGKRFAIRILKHAPR